MSTRRRAAGLFTACALAAALLAAQPATRAAAARGGTTAAHGPDASYREALTALHDAAADTAAHAGDPAALDALGVALLKLARFTDADRIFRRVLAEHPDDRVALAGAGHVALCRNDEASAESLLARAGDTPGAAHDLYLARLRRHAYGAAAAMAESQDESGRREMLERLEGHWPPAGPVPGTGGTVAFVRTWPVPLVRVSLNGRQVLMAVDPSASELLIDPATAHRCGVELAPGERSVAWCGARVGARNAFAQKLLLGDFAFTDVPAAVTALHKYSLAVNPEGIDIAGVLGLSVLERLGVTLDFRRAVLELRAERGTPPSARVAGRVPFERWDENMLVVYGTIEGARRMAFWVGTGLPEAGLGAPQETFDEAGAQPGRFANLVRGLGTALQGRPWSQVSVSSLTVGPIVIGRIDSWGGAMAVSEMWRNGARLDGVLGPKFFAKRRVTFDWLRHDLVFEDSD